MNDINRVLLTDSYKSGQFEQVPPNTTSMSSYFESRGSERGYEKSVFFGLQYFLKKYWTNPIELWEIQEAKEVFADRGESFNEGAWLRLLEKHDGKLPIRVRAVPEGSVVHLKNVLFTVESTDEEFFWLPDYIETSFVRAGWYGTTVATQSYYLRELIYKYLMETADDPDSEIPFKLHDFGARGASSHETAQIGGAAHLAIFQGSDTLEGVVLMKRYYNEFKGLTSSIAASQHSTISSWDKEHEIDAYRNMLNLYKGRGILACVSDTWDIYNACENIWGEELKQEVIDSGATVVVRPDCYDEETQLLTSKGWKYFKNLSPRDLVAQVLDDGTYEFVPYTNYVNKMYKGEMIKFSDHFGKVNLLVTPNHRMVYKHKNRGVFEVEEAKTLNISYDKKYLIRSAKAKNLNVRLTPLERLNIAFQADGNFCTGRNNSYSKSSIRFQFSKQRKINRIEKILKDCDLKYKSYSLKDGKTEFNIKIDTNLVSKEFNWVRVENLCSTWSQEFIEEMSYWDSTIRSENSVQYTTTNKNVVPIVEMISLSAGYGCLIRENNDTRSQLFSNTYILQMLKGNRCGGQSVKKESILYNGRIYCVTVPSGRLLVKRGKSTLVCGNSGDPVTVLCGISKDKYFMEVDKFYLKFPKYLNPYDEYGAFRKGKEVSENEIKGIFRILEEKFGATVNSKGYKLLNYVRVIQGDGVNPDSIQAILQAVKESGFSASNIAFGMGGALLQKVDRDTLKFAYKCSSAIVDGKRRDVFKDPVTDIQKQSKKGRLDLILENGEYKTVNLIGEELCKINTVLRTVFENGVVYANDRFSEIRERASLEKQINEVKITNKN